MFECVVDLLRTAINAALFYFDRLLEGIPGSWNYIFSFLCIALVAKFFLSPLLGKWYVGSDRVRSRERTRVESSNSRGEYE